MHVAREPFAKRVRSLPKLGLGISTEYGARSAGGLDPLRLAAEHPGFARFLEVGVEVAKGLDDEARRWSAAGRATTYHFLDVNLDEPEDLDAPWLAKVQALIAELRPAWLCGDAGLWHFGPREPGHMLLLPPVLTRASAHALAAGVRTLREATGLEVLPENPPGQVFIGDLHLLAYFAELAEAADTGLLLDLSHLAIYQRTQGLPPDAGLADFPLERVVEIHVAGGTLRDHEGLTWVEDAHGATVLPEVWDLFAAVVPRARNLKAVVFECERNALEDTLAGFARLASILDAGAAT
jgi:uncharacterized protein (UPF0276 family)